MYRRSPPRHDPDKLDPVPVLECAPGPFLAGQSFEVKLNQKLARIEPATCRELAQRRRGAYLPCVAVDENAQALLDRFGHKSISHKSTRKTHKRLRKTGHFFGLFLVLESFGEGLF